MFPRELYAPVNKEREKVPFFQSSNKKLLKEWKCFLANYILLRYILHTERGRERGREKVPFFQSMFPGQETFEEMKTKRNERGKGRNVSSRIVCSCEQRERKSTIFLVLEQETFKGMEIFPRELCTFANIEREREREKFLRFDINPNSIRNSTIPTPNRDNLHTSRIPYIYIKRESRKTRITRLQNARKHSQS